ncbi:phage Gp37/Gp68 family protein (plasmid) [Streptomyces sp. NBC_01007]|nr:phage Gp37/Gp68 family protein [Streptomyces sp. NBC_01007]
MADHTTIEWTDSTWNPVTGCTKLSDSCANRYAATFAERWHGGVAGHHLEQGFGIVLRSDRLRLSMTWKAPRCLHDTIGQQRDGHVRLGPWLAGLGLALTGLLRGGGLPLGHLLLVPGGLPRSRRTKGQPGDRGPRRTLAGRSLRRGRQ